jgi:hypothetical protein
MSSSGKASSLNCLSKETGWNIILDSERPGNCECIFLGRRFKRTHIPKRPRSLVSEGAPVENYELRQSR